MKKNILLCFFIALLSFGCATTMPQSTPESRAEIQALMSRFEQAKTISAGEIPDVYNASRLSKGSNVKIKYTRNNLDKPYFSTQIVREVKVDNKGRVYVIDSIVAERTFTRQEDSLSLGKIVSPYEDIHPLADLKEGLSKSDNLPTAIVKGAIAAGPVGAVLNALDSSRMREINNEVIAHVKGMRIETKVIDFKFVSDERLKIAGKDILCKVYQIHSLIRQTAPSGNRIPSSSFIIDKSEQMWISEDVPFGIAKRESTQILHMCMDENNNRMAFAPASQTTHEINEVVEFNY